MSQRLQVNASPCASCPYAKSTPPGIWAASEYERLRGHDDNTAFSTFLCHHTPAIGVDTVCRGWLTVQAESVSARLAVKRGFVTDEERYAPVAAALYASGNEAADAGLAGVEQPDTAACRMAARLVRARQRRG